MASKDRVYRVKHSDKDHLVRASNKAQAINHVARHIIMAEVASQDDLIELAGKVEVETAGETAADE